MRSAEGVHSNPDNRNSMRHPRATLWEKKLRQVFTEIDEHLEQKYGELFPLHPARPARGATASSEHDGLFNLGASFTAGYGSRYGPGYAIEVRMVTLSEVPYELRDRLEREVVEYLRVRLPEVFPGKELHVDRDGCVYKIYGDLSLGRL